MSRFGWLCVVTLWTVGALSGCDGGNRSCGDGLCDTGFGESCATCAVDCGTCAGCGDGTCAASMGESCTSCAADCGSCGETCGNGVCAGGEDCNSCPGDCGGCSTSCGPSSCAGCCDGDACLGGSSPSGCGLGGNTCMACGASFTCSGGACVVDPVSRWNVVIERVEVNQYDLAGENWDVFGGLPDPFVEVRVGSETAIPTRTRSAADTFTANLNTVAASNVRADALMAHLSFWVYDEDTSAHDRVGACGGMVTEPIFGGMTQTSNCARDVSAGQAGFVLTWHLERF
ncbi:MAG: hypothetical protein RLO52_34120 [Sandaracinaceae bacterium]